MKKNLLVSYLKSPGVNVIVKNTTNGTNTDFNGNFWAVFVSDVNSPELMAASSMFSNLNVIFVPAFGDHTFIVTWSKISMSIGSVRAGLLKLKCLMLELKILLKKLVEEY